LSLWLKWPCSLSAAPTAGDKPATLLFGFSAAKVINFPEPAKAKNARRQSLVESATIFVVFANRRQEIVDFETRIDVFETPN